MPKRRRKRVSKRVDFSDTQKATVTDNANHLPLKGVIPIDQMFGGDEEDTKLLRAMSTEAQAYIQSFSWCKSIRETYFGDGYGGIIALFFFRIEPTKANVDEWLWVVVGDLPSAYLVIDRSKNPSQALENYIDEMSKWVKLAKQGKSSKNVIPVNVAATPENAEALEGRLKFLREVMVPAFQAAEVERA
jgi:hypothetical protein